MRIAQVAPLYESVPPKLYGGTERVVSYLTEELVRQGHPVTLFASGDSRTRAKLAAPCPHSLRLSPEGVDPLAYHTLMVERVYRQSQDFDVIHAHIDFLHYPLARRSRIPVLTTLHGRLDLPYLVPIYREFSDLPMVSISGAQRAPLPWVHWVGTVHHSLPRTLHAMGKGNGNYLAFLGRISPEKRVDLAIEIAKRAGMKLKIAAKVDPADQEYFRREIEPSLDHPLVEYLGEIGESEKGIFLGEARALLFPIDWPEPFGLVMIEAMACGTPVIARPRGSVPEILEQGRTGFLCESVEAAVQALDSVESLDRAAIRQTFENRFSAERMAGDYLSLYRRLIEEWPCPK
ncbi:MAG TPA: glycosyltransferase family 4 protein [bacterium]|nr:glycosyltransferase family 4 protein [bacterium]